MAWQVLQMEVGGCSRRMNLGSGPSLRRRTKFVKLSVQLHQHQQGRNLALVWEIPFYLILKVEL